MHQIGQIYNRVMALDPSQNFISSKYLKNVYILHYTLILTRSRFGLL